MKGKAAAIGTFDGVHLGHVAVLDRLREKADANGLDPMAITFDRHPLSLIAPERAPMAITTTEKKMDLIAKTGVTPFVIPFDEDLRSTTAREWMQMLHDRMGVRLIVVGYDNTFGSDGINYSIADYKKIGEETGIIVEDAPVVPGISSSAVRKAIAGGDIGKASEMLGRDFTLPGFVVEGNKLGRTIGFPTANVMPEAGIIVPGNGVYAATATLPDGSRRNAVVNVGVRPTVRRGNNLTVEAHILDWKGDLYGCDIRLTFRARIRDEIKFNSIESLRQQIKKDVEEAQLFLKDITKPTK